jgi:acyl-homoserine-lactone acylase
VVDDLVAAAEAHGTPLAKQAAAVLKSWDRAAEIESRGGLLFEAFANRFLGPALANRSGFAVAEDWRQPFATPRGLKDPAKAAAQLDEAAAETIKLYGTLDAPWGQFRRFALAKTDLPANGTDGNLGAFRVMRFAPMGQGHEGPEGRVRGHVHRAGRVRPAASGAGADELRQFLAAGLTAH